MTLRVPVGVPDRYPGVQAVCGVCEIVPPLLYGCCGRWRCRHCQDLHEAEHPRP